MKIMSINLLYLISFTVAFIISLLLVPVMRLIAIKFKILDHPNTAIKTHQVATPYLGGLGIFLGYTITLFLLRLLTHFPTGTLRALRGMFLGSIIVVLLGLIDDIKPKLTGYKKKFVVQLIASVLLILYGIHIKFVSPEWLGYTITIIWVIGMSNALNIIDIMDGLCAGVTIIASLAFFFIALLGEEIYVNFASVSLAGACLGFLPYNLSHRYKIFMGDTGSMFVGFILSAISIGTAYTQLNQIALFAPILILGIPIYDTFFVIYQRYRQKKSPFLGSKDHFALRLEKIGYSRNKILVLTCLINLLLCISAFVVTRVSFITAVSIYVTTIIVAFLIGYRLSKINVQD